MLVPCYLISPFLLCFYLQLNRTTKQALHPIHHNIGIIGPTHISSWSFNHKHSHNYYYNINYIGAILVLMFTIFKPNLKFKLSCLAIDIIYEFQLVIAIEKVWKLQSIRINININQYTFSLHLDLLQVRKLSLEYVKRMLKN